MPRDTRCSFFRSRPIKQTPCQRGFSGDQLRLISLEHRDWAKNREFHALQASLAVTRSLPGWLAISIRYE